MGLFSGFRRRKHSAAVTEEERIARYVYLLNTLPASVIESAHAAAFADVPAQRRREMFEQLRPFMSESERSASPEDPHVLARLVRRAEERRPSAPPPVTLRMPPPKPPCGRAPRPRTTRTSTLGR